MRKTGTKSRTSAAKKTKRHTNKVLAAKSKKSIGKSHKVKPKPHTKKTHTKRSGPAGTNVIWKFLEMKEQRRREMHEQHAESHSRNHAGGNTKYGHAQMALNRFHGPRRKAA